jgi:demethylmenaquinone methyltransferase / 2-methoxy-6-polyprenyl-1,4-benzoquinol methylase
VKDPVSYEINNKAPEEKKRFIQNLFDSIVPTYDLLNHVLSAGIDTLWRKNIFRLIDPVKGKPVIDLCCGTGDLSRLLDKNEARLFSLDFSMNMLRRGIEKNALCGDSVAADASRIPFSDNTFHTATIAFGIRNIPDLDNFIREVHRVIIPGGQFVILELVRPANKIISSLYSMYLGKILPFIGGMISGERIAYKYLSGTIATFIDPLDLEVMLEKYGFVSTTHHLQTFGVASIIICRRMK